MSVKNLFHNTGEGTGSADKLDMGDVDDVLIKLGEDDEDEIEEEVKDDTDKDVEETDKKVKSRDKEDTRTDEEKLDLEDEDIKIDAPPRKKELEKAYPGIFDKFKFLDKMMFRDRKYQEMFGSFDDAREAQEKAATLDELEADVMNGNAESLLKKIKDGDDKAFAKFTRNLIPTLAKVDKEAYVDIVSDVITRAIARVANHGKAKDDKDIQNAALILNEVIFGTSELQEPRKSKGEPEEDQDLKREREEFENERLELAVSEISTRVDNVLKNTINDYIDKRGEMSAFEKKAAIREALEYINNKIREDLAFKRSYDKLWTNAIKDRFSSNSKEKIRSAFLGRAKQEIPFAIKKARQEVLGSKVKRRNASDETPEEPRKGPISGRSTPSRSGKPQMKPGESVQDFLMRD